MICPKCSKEIPDGSKFCLECGSNISAISGESGQEPPERSVGDYKTAPDAVMTQNDDSQDVSVGGMVTMEGNLADFNQEQDPSVGDIHTLQQADSADPNGSSIIKGVPLSDRYELLEEIGRGGFAAVWKARDKKLDRIVAVKRLLDPHSSEAVGKINLQRFRREARTIAGLNHINVVAVYDVDQDKDGDYIIMEMVEGGSLRECLDRQGKLEVPEAIALIRGVAQGLAYAHKKNLIHRDIKPANILLQDKEDGKTPKIVDFGLSRAGAESGLSMTGYGMGTPYYMSPEQRRDAKSVNHTADIYALGKTFYEMLTGDIPDQVDPEKMPRHLARVVLKCVKASPDERYFSMDEFLQDLASGSVGGNNSGNDNSYQSEFACFACGKINPPDGKYCEGCGQGLFKPCPECERENRATVQFCSGCGTDIQAFSKYSEALEKMTGLKSDHKFKRVLKECKLLPANPRLQGKKGKRLVDSVNDMRREAEDKINLLESLHAKLNEAREAADYDRALANLMQIKEIDPRNQEIAELHSQLLREKEKSEWEQVQKEVEDYKTGNDYKKALDTLWVYTDNYPAGQFRKKAEYLRQHLCKHRLKYLWEKAETEAEQARTDNDLEKALKIYRDFIAAEPEYADKTEAPARAERLEEQLREINDRKNWEAARDSAKSSFDAGYWGHAIIQIQAFIEKFPENRHLEQAHNKLNEYQSRHHDEIEKKWRQINQFLDDRQLSEARNIVESALVMTGSYQNDKLMNVKQDIEIRLLDVSKYKMQAKTKAKHGNFISAIDIIDRVMTVDAGDSELKYMRSRFQSLYEKQLHDKALRRKRMIMTAAAIVIISTVAVASYSAHRVFWNYRFANAIAEKNMSEAEAAARSLPRHITEESLGSLEEYHQKREELLSSIAQQQSLFEQYGSDKLENINKLLENATKEKDIEKASHLLAEATNLYHHFEKQASDLIKVNSEVREMLNRETAESAERLLPARWEKLQMNMDEAAGTTTISDATSAYKQLETQLNDLYQETEELLSEEEKLVNRQEELADSIAGLNESNLAEYAENEHRELAEFFQKHCVSNASPENFNVLWVHFVETEKKKDELSVLLAQAHRLNAHLSQLDRSLAADRDLLQDNGSEEWRKYSQIQKDMQTMRSIRPFIASQRQAIDLADRLSIEADRLRQR